MRKHWYTEDDRELMVIEDMEEARNVAEYETWLNRTTLKPEPHDDAFDENDPDDRLRSEGGRL